MAVWIPYKNVGEPIVIEAIETLVAGDPVKRDTNGVSKTGDAQQVLGVCATDIASGETGTVWTKGIFKVTAGGDDLEMGQLVAAGAAGVVDDGGGSDSAVGVVVEADAASGTTVKVLLYSDSALTT